MKRAHASAYLNEMAMAMELLGEPPAQIAAHRETAMKIETIPPGEWDEWLVEFALRDKASELEERLSRIPPGLYLLLKLPGLTPALVRRLWIEGQIISIKRLERACHREALIKIDGFDRKTQTRLQLEIKRLRRRRSLWLRRTALEVAAEREEQLAGTRGIIRFAQSGELRRNLEVVSEISWVIAADPPQRVLGRLGTLAGAILPTPQTPDTICFAISDRIRERMVVVNESEYIARIFFETGVPAHTRDILMRLSERDDPATPPITETEIYERAALQYIPPELREDRGEIEAAAAGQLPELVTPEDIRGVLHVHTTWSDGKGSIHQMAQRATEMGWSYVGISDHSEAAFYAHGLSPEQIGRQHDAIAIAQDSCPNVKIFHGIECDILPDGQLDLDDSVLSRLDFVIVSVHNVLKMDRESMTRRLIRAISNPHATLLGHPSGRLLLEREGYPVDWDRLFDAAAESETAIEFNAPGERLDLDWRLIRRATSRGVRICINPDAHTLAAMDAVISGVATARKGWLTRDQLLNSLEATAMEKFLDGLKARATGSRSGRGGGEGQ